MSAPSWIIIASGLFFSGCGQARELAAPAQPAELCQAFPWDEPVEQTFTVASVLRWRHDVRRAGDVHTVTGKRKP